MSLLSAADGLFGSFSHYLYKITNTSNTGHIGKFINKVNAVGAAHNHLFLVTIAYMRGGLTSDDVELLSLFCHATSIPALNVMTSPYRENEAHFEVPYGISHEPVTFTFYGDANLKIKKAFDIWYQNITRSRVTANGQHDNRLQLLQDMTCDVSIVVLDKANTNVYTVVLKNAWPKSIGNIDLHAQNTDVISFPVQFVYERLEIINPEVGNDMEGSSSVRPATPLNFPVNIFNTATEVAGNLIQAATGWIPQQVTQMVGTALNIKSTVDAVRTLIK